MKLACPHCRHAIEVVQMDDAYTLPCPSCGSSLASAIDTATFRPRAVQVIPGFELMERVGAGHYGEVWKTKDLRLNRIVALKMPRVEHLDQGTVDLFVREARAAAHLRHPAITTVYDVMVEDGRVFIVSEFVNGPSLAEYMTAYRLSPVEAAELYATIADALHHAHAAGVIHRDLKPANILLNEKKEPHVTDFGLAKRDGETITITTDGHILGTPAYMSPEQAAGRGHYADARSDLYSLGVILYELLAGKRPFIGESRLLLHQVLHEEPKSLRAQLPDIPRDIETICLKALAKEPGQRFTTAAEFAEELRRFSRGEPIQSRPIHMVERAWRWTRRNPARAALTAFATAACVLTTLVIINSVRRSGEHLRSTSQLQGQLDTSAENATRMQQQLQELEALVPPNAKPVDVQIQTSPPGGRVLFWPLDQIDGSYRLEKMVSGAGPETVQAKLLPGDYLVVAMLPNGDFHEVFRRIPAAANQTPGVYPHESFRRNSRGQFELPTVVIPATAAVVSGMTLLPSTEKFRMGSGASVHHRSVPEFYLEPTEVTRGALRSVVKLPQIEDKALSDDFPATNVTISDALAYAELVGKILPEETQYEYAATRFGTGKFPWGDDMRPGPWSLGPVGQPEYDVLYTTPVVHGLFSNALEWTTSWGVPYEPRPGMPLTGITRRVVRGGPSATLNGDETLVGAAELAEGSRMRFVRESFKPNPMIGFRCARSVRPRQTATDFVRRLDEAPDPVASSR